MQQKKMDDPLASMRELIEAAAKEAVRVNPQLARKPEPLSDEEWEQRICEDEERYKQLDALLQGGGGLSVSAQVIEDRGEK